MSNNSWMTPMWVLLKVHNVMGGIDLDPASCAEANKKVEAKRFFDGTQVDALTISYWSTYPETIYLNPPGGKKNNIPVARIFWTKLMQHLDKGLVKQAIFMGFNIELLRTTQNLLLHKAAVDFPFCLPTQRIEFDHPDKKRSESPRNASTIIYIPGTQDNTAGFIREFQQVGAICRSITN